jgi:hypothetical protein
VLALVAIAAVLAGYGLVHGGDAAPAAEGAAAAAPAADTAPADAAPVAAVAPGPAAPAAAHELHMGRISVAMREKQRRREEIARLRLGTPDKLALVRALLASARAGDAEAEAAIARAFMECMMWTYPDSEGRSWQEHLQDPRLPAGERAIVEKGLGSCGPLNSASPDEVGTYAQWQELARESGDGLAVMDQELPLDGQNIDAHLSNFHQAVATGDSAVLRRIFNNYAVVSDGLGWNGLPRDEYRHQYRLFKAISELSACELGEDCSGQSVRADCSNAPAVFDCSYAGDPLRYYELHLSPADYAYVTNYAQTLTDHFLSGNTDWPEARAYEDWLRKAAKDTDAQAGQK